MALQSHPLRHHRGAYYPSQIPRSITMVLLLFPASQQGRIRHPQVAGNPSDRHLQHSLTHYRHRRRHLLPRVLNQYLRSSGMISSCLLLHHHRPTHLPHAHRRWYDVIAVFEIRSASVKLVSVGALSVLKWCRAGDSVKGKEDERKAYSSE